MNIVNSNITAGWMLLQALCLPSGYAQETDAESIIDIAGYQVPVKTGGLYDKYRSNPPLSVIAEQAPDMLGKLMKYRYAPEFQSALYAPVTLEQAQGGENW